MTHIPSASRVVRIHASKLKLGLLVVPCVLAVVITLQADGAPEFALENLRIVHFAAIAIAIAVGGIVLHMAFEKAPVLVLDEDGIHCRRPPIGLIPWASVIAVGAGRATLMRRVLMIAAESSRLPPEARDYAKNSMGALTLISPQLGRFALKTRGAVRFYIPISLLAMSAPEIERTVQGFIQKHVDEEDGPQRRDTS